MTAVGLTSRRRSSSMRCRVPEVRGTVQRDDVRGAQQLLQPDGRIRASGHRPGRRVGDGDPGTEDREVAGHEPSDSPESDDSCSGVPELPAP